MNEVCGGHILNDLNDLRHQFGKISTCSLIMIRSAMYESYYACKTGEREEEMQTISHTLHMGFFLLTKNT